MVILLTATIDTRETAHIVRRDPKVRLGDYRNSLVLWLRNPTVRKLVFCENSRYDLTELERVSESNNPHGTEVEFLSFEGNSFPPQLGKGPGELANIHHALTHSRLMKTDARVMKITGRFYVTNVARIIRQIGALPETELFCDLRGDLTYGDGRAFCVSPLFLDKYLAPMRHLADDSKRVFFEHLLGRAIHRALSDGVTWAMMPSVPNLRGISGTGGIAYRGLLPGRIARGVLRSVRSFAFAR